MLILCLFHGINVSERARRRLFQAVHIQWSAFMIKSLMVYIDVLFPVSLGRLTYRCPEGLAHDAKPGMIVSAPLRNKNTLGVIVSRSGSPPQDAIRGQIREITALHGERPVLSPKMIELIHWMSEYYIAIEGNVLKQTLPDEIFVGTGQRKSRRKTELSKMFGTEEVSEDILSAITRAVSENKYRTFLAHIPSLDSEYSMTLKILNTIRNVIVLLPEIAPANMLYDEISRGFGDRPCLLHSGLSKGKRSENIAGILSGKHDIVVGTRAALFAPLKKVSLIIVLQEHNGSYKLEEGIRYNIRDVAVMRGYLEKAVVLLSSVSPSIDSYFNALSKKYSQIGQPPVETGKSGQPGMRIIDMRSAKKVTPAISRTVFEAVRSRLAAGKRTMFVINRRGHSTVVQCSECGHTEDCPKCGIPLVMHKDRKTMECHRCGLSRGIPENCGRCRSVRLEMLGSGTQKIQEELSELFGVDAPRFDSDSVKKGREKIEMMQYISEGPARIIIGTKMMTHKILSGKFSAAVVLNIDAALNQPDFRAYEKAYAELVLIRDFVEPDGEMFIQTRFPGNHLFRYLKQGDYKSFAAEELSLRKELSFPPYARLLNLIITGDAALPDKIIGYVNSLNRNIEALGPLSGTNRKGSLEHSVLLKSQNRQLLNETAREILKRYGNAAGIKILPDIDPA